MKNNICKIRYKSLLVLLVVLFTIFLINFGGETAYAYPGWVSPTSVNDPDDVWYDDDNARDGLTSTKAYVSDSFSGGEWSSYLVLIRAAFWCDKIQYWQNAGVWIDEISIDVFDGSWTNIYEGPQGASLEWVERQLDQTRYITKVKFKYLKAVGYTTESAELYEVEFNEVEATTVPTVTTEDATDVSFSSATGNGNVTDIGVDEPTDRGFEYGLTDSYGDSVSAGAGGEGAFSKSITGLLPDKLYHYRSYATNSAGTGYGSDVTFTTESESFPCKNHNVWGWAWSENVGWISMSCENCDADHDGFTGPEQVGDKGGYTNCPVGESITDYGVDIDPDTGLFSGYAWAGGGENADGSPVPTIGWIRFDPEGSYPAIGPGYSACINLPGVSDEVCEPDLAENEVGGWARACAVFEDGFCEGAANLRPDSERGGWDGWIKLRDTDYETWLYTSVTPSEFRDWGWGGGGTTKESAVIGWISFNCKDVKVCSITNQFCGEDPDCPGGETCVDTRDGCSLISDYKVMIDLTISEDPYIEDQLIEYHYYCPPQCGQGKGQIGFQWTYKDIDGDPQTKYEFAIDTDTVFDESSVFYLSVDNPEGPTNHQAVVIGNDISYNTRYYWGVRVWDDHGKNSGWITYNDPADNDHFPVPPGSPGNPGSPGDGFPDSFTTASHAWPWPAFDYFPPNPTTEDDVDFTDQTTFYDTGTSWTWNFGDGIGTSSEQHPSYSYKDAGTGIYTVDLKAEDSAGYACSTDSPVNVETTLRLPTWKEIVPF